MTDSPDSGVSTTSSDHVEACPKCDQTAIVKKQGTPDQRQHPEDYRCTKCCHHFDTPTTRLRWHPKQERTRSPAANKLLDADPEMDIRVEEDS